MAGDTIADVNITFYCPTGVDTMNWVESVYDFDMGVISRPVKYNTSLHYSNSHMKCTEETFYFQVLPYNLWPGSSGERDAEVLYVFATTVQPSLRYSSSWEYVIRLNAETPTPSQLSGLTVVADLESSIRMPNVVTSDTLQLQSTATSPDRLEAARLTLVQTTFTNATTGAHLRTVDGAEAPPGDGCMFEYSQLPNSGVRFVFPTTCVATWDPVILVTYRVNLTDHVYAYPSQFVTLTTDRNLQPSGGDSSSSNMGLVIGASVGGVVGFVVIVLLCVRCYRRRHVEGSMLAKLLGEDSAGVSFV